MFPIAVHRSNAIKVQLGLSILVERLFDFAFKGSRQMKIFKAALMANAIYSEHFDFRSADFASKSRFVLEPDGKGLHSREEAGKHIFVSAICGTQMELRKVERIEKKKAE